MNLGVRDQRGKLERASPPPTKEEWRGGRTRTSRSNLISSFPVRSESEIFCRDDTAGVYVSAFPSESGRKRRKSSATTTAYLAHRDTLRQLPRPSLRTAKGFHEYMNKPSPSFFPSTSLVSQFTHLDLALSQTSSIQDHAFAGLGAGVVSVLCMHPLDLLKVQFQVSTQHPKGGAGKQIWLALKDIKESHGWKGLYRGVGPNIAGNASSWGLYFLL